MFEDDAYVDVSQTGLSGKIIEGADEFAIKNLAGTKTMNLFEFFSSMNLNSR
ncbi:2677_t:CDS:2 [Dentiscutata erythropus]|uniref:2677_t:CDS:1 n=1 Tax=Dentiscutata erythropus TaxID=1348616 RepID=A0A9N8YZK4_9GLOM|nr:2677_t:CDS:2 [Dentiscutata erythropus]